MMKIGDTTINPLREAICCLVAAAMTFGFYSAGKILFGQGELGLVPLPLLLGAVGVGFGFWIWYQIDQIVKQKTVTAATPLIVVTSVVFGLLVGMLTRERLLDLGVSQTMTFVVWGIILMMGVGLGFRVRFLLLRG